MRRLLAAGGSFGYGLRSFSCNGQNYQRWQWIAWSDGTSTFVNENTGRAIDDSSGYGLAVHGGKVEAALPRHRPRRTPRGIDLLQRPAPLPAPKQHTGTGGDV
jgi:hypothetical protein